MKELNAEELIKFYALEKHPEGGYFRETYRSEGNFSTAIYFLLKEGMKSRLHRIKSDEVWHFYSGGPLTIAQIAAGGRLEYNIIGRDQAAGQKFRHTVPAGCWFGAYPGPGTDFSFVGCTVAPAFGFEDLELGDRAALIKQFPSARELILKLTD